LSGIRWTTGIGIAVGGAGGAIAALMGAPAAPPAARVVEQPVSTPAKPSAAAPVAAVTEPAPSSEPAPTAAPAPVAVPSASPSVTPAASAAAKVIIPELVVPTTTEALLKAEVLCDRKKSYDDCSRSALALEQGSAGPVDAVQAKRFRRIALTYLVAECEIGDPHACFIMAEKYRSGSELSASPVRAAALEKRGLELCRLRSAAECPPQ
jgi:hypothetical protein